MRQRCEKIIEHIHGHIWCNRMNPRSIQNAETCRRTILPVPPPSLSPLRDCSQLSPLTIRPSPEPHKLSEVDFRAKILNSCYTALIQSRDMTNCVAGTLFNNGLNDKSVLHSRHANSWRWTIQNRTTRCSQKFFLRGNLYRLCLHRDLSQQTK